MDPISITIELGMLAGVVVGVVHSFHVWRHKREELRQRERHHKERMAAGIVAEVEE